MALVFCTKCGHQVSTTALRCPACKASRYVAADAASISSKPAQPADLAVAATTKEGAVPSTSLASSLPSKSMARRFGVFGGILLTLVLLSILIMVGLQGLFAIVKNNLLGWPQPVFVGEVEVDPEGNDGYRVWFTLADADRRETASRGQVMIRINVLRDGIPLGTAFSRKYKVEYSDFSYWTFENQFNGYRTRRLIWSSKRILSDDFREFEFGDFKRFLRLPGPQLDGTADVEFTTTDGEELRGTSSPFSFRE